MASHGEPLSPSGQPGQAAGMASSAADFFSATSRQPRAVAVGANDPAYLFLCVSDAQKMAKRQALEMACQQVTTEHLVMAVAADDQLSRLLGLPNHNRAQLVTRLHNFLLKNAVRFKGDGGIELPVKTKGFVRVADRLKSGIPMVAAIEQESEHSIARHYFRELNIQSSSPCSDELHIVFTAQQLEAS